MEKKKGARRKKEVHYKEQTNVRVDQYELQLARKIADGLSIKISDYFLKALHDANEKYGERVRIWTR